MECRRCGRKLKDSESVRMGYGPTCRAMMGIKIPKKNTRPKKGTVRPDLQEKQVVESDIPGQTSIFDNPDWLPDSMKGENHG